MTRVEKCKSPPPPPPESPPPDPPPPDSPLVDESERASGGDESNGSPWLFKADELPPVPASAREAPRSVESGLFDMNHDD